MKVKLSKNMKLIAIIVLSLIIITYMFYNSVKEGIGGGNKKKKGGKYTRQKWTSKTDCMNREIEREPKCMIKDPNSGKFIACDPENKDHKEKIDKHDKMLKRWKDGWCAGQEGIYKKKTEYDPKTVSWMKDNYSRWKNDVKKSLDEDISIYPVSYTHLTLPTS